MKTKLLKTTMLILTLMMVLSVSAYAADTTAPVITHNAVTDAIESNAVSIRAEITDDSDIAGAFVYFRSEGMDKFIFARMIKAGTVYAGQIPGKYVVPSDLEYYIMASDSAGNIQTLMGPGGDPFVISVTALQSIAPDAQMVYPNQTVTQSTGLVIAIKLNEAFAKVDSGMVTLTFDGQDVTNQSKISKSMITYMIPEKLASGVYNVDLSVADVNGTPYSKRFTFVVELPLTLTKVASEPSLNTTLSFGYSYDADKKAGSTLIKLNSSGQLGPIGMRASLRSDDPIVTGKPGQSKSRLSLIYKSRLLDLNIIDSSPTLTDMTMKGYSIRGLSGEFRLGPFAWDAVYGTSKQKVTGETYERKALALRSSSDLFGVIKTGVTFAQVADIVAGVGEVPVLINDVDALQSYTLTVDGGLDLFGATLSTEVGANIYMEGVRNRMDWDEFLTDINGSSNKTLSGFLNTVLPIPDYYVVKKAIDAIDNGDPLPAGFDLASLVLPKLDFGMMSKISVPVAGSKLEGRYFWIGQNFKSLAADVPRGYRGYDASLSDINIGDSLTLSFGIGSKVDQVASPLLTPSDASGIVDDLVGNSGDPIADALKDLIVSGLGSRAGSDQVRYDTAEFSAETLIADSIPVGFGYESIKRNAYKSGTPLTNENQYSIYADSISYAFGGNTGTLGLGLTLSSIADIKDKADSSNGTEFDVNVTLPISAVNASVRASIGNTVDLNNETTSADDVSVKSNKIQISLGKSIGKLGLRLTGRYGVRDDGLPLASSSIKSTESSALFAADYRLTKTSKVSFEYRASTYVDSVDSSWNSQKHTVNIGYKIAF